MVLEPLSARHAEDRLEASREPEIWRWMPYTITGTADLAAWLELSLERSAAARARRGGPVPTSRRSS